MIKRVLLAMLWTLFASHVCAQAPQFKVNFTKPGNGGSWQLSCATMNECAQGAYELIANNDPSQAPMLFDATIYQIGVCLSDPNANPLAQACQNICNNAACLSNAPQDTWYTFGVRLASEAASGGYYDLLYVKLSRASLGCQSWDGTYTGIGTAANKGRRSAFTATLTAIYAAGDPHCGAGANNGCGDTSPPNANNYLHCVEGCGFTCFNPSFETVKVIGQANTSSFTIGQVVTVQGVCTPTGQECSTNASGQTVVQINVPSSNQFDSAPATAGGNGNTSGQAGLDIQDKANLQATATNTSTAASMLNALKSGQDAAAANAATRHSEHMGLLSAIKGVLEQIRDKPGSGTGSGTSVDGVSTSGDAVQGPGDPSSDRPAGDLSAPGEANQPLMNLKSLSWSNSNPTSCPTWTFNVWDKDFTINSHCQLFENNRAAMQAVMTAIWLLLALIIVLSA